MALDLCKEMNRQYSNELYHHGIKGMHWGVRRYQNKDGTYTSAGKQRRSSFSEQPRDSSKGKGLSDRKRKALKVGAALAVAGLAAYGTQKVVLGGKHSATRKATQLAYDKGKQKVKSTLKKAGSTVVSDVKKTVKSAPGKAYKSIKKLPGEAATAAKKGARDAAKIAGTGLAIEALRRKLEKQYGKEEADRIVLYGRKPFPKK